MRRPIKHRLGITLSVIIPGVLLTLAIMGLSKDFTGLSTPLIKPAANTGPSDTVNTLANQLNIGVFKPAPNRVLTSVQNFGNKIHHKPDMLLIYSEWLTKFRIGIAYSALKRHITLIDQIEPKGINLQNIYSDKYDSKLYNEYNSYLYNFATSVRDFGHRIIIGFGHEMNGTWYSWSKYPPADFVAAWKHVVYIFNKAGATNVTWMWTIHHASIGIHAYWPGAKYVDLVGIDGYFETPQNTFQNIFGVSIRAVQKFTKLPIMIGETAVGQYVGHNMTRDVHSLFFGVHQYGLYGLVWFDEPQAAKSRGSHHQDWELEDHPAALHEFQTEVKYYSAK
jgi:hypothetical protein